MSIRRRGPGCGRVAVAACGSLCALALAASPAAAATTVIGFDDQPSGTVIGEQYAALGVHFGPSPFVGQSGGFTADARPLQARSASNVAAFAYDAGTVFSSSSITFDKQQRKVTFYACRTGGSDPTPNVNVVAYDSNGTVVDNQGGILCNRDGPLVPVTIEKDHISVINVYGTGGAAAPGPGWGLDDLTFETDPPPQGPPPLPPPPPPPPPPDFSLDFLEGPTTPHVLAVRPGGSNTRPLVVGRNETSTGPVGLSVSGLPAGVTATFNPTTPSSNRAVLVTMTVHASASVAPTFATVTVRGAPQSATAGAQPHTTTFDLVVQGQLAAYVKGVEITQGVQTGGQPAVSPYKGVGLVTGKLAVVRVYAGFIGSEAAQPEGSPRPELGMTLSGSDRLGRALPGSPLVAQWSPPPGSLTLNSTVIGPNERASGYRAFVFTLPDTWTYRGSIALRAQAIAASEPPNPFDRPIPPGATICIDTSCGATPVRDLNQIPFLRTPEALVISAVEQDLTSRDAAGKVTFTSKPLDAPHTFARLMQISPVPFAFFDAGNNASPIPRYRAVRDAPTDKIWEDADAFDVQIGRVGHSTFGAFNSSKDAGVSFTRRTSVGTSDPGGAGNPDRPLTVIAHEVLHTVGIGHADQSKATGGCGGNGGGFPDPTGRLGSVGIDTLSLSGGAGPSDPPYRMISDTTDTPGYDLMSYCAALGNGDPNSWISAINWNAMLGAGTPPAHRATSAAPDPVTATTLHVRARVQGGRVQIDSVGRSAGPPLRAPVSSYRLVARDRAGRALSSVAMTSADVEGAAGAAGFSVLDGEVPAAGVARVEVSLGGSLVASTIASVAPPTAAFITPRAGTRVGAGRSVSVRWRTSDRDGDRVAVELDYSADGGRTFHNVYGAAARSRAVLPVELFSTARKARLRLRINDGFHDAEIVSPTFVVVPRPPKVTILVPTARLRVAAGSSVYLRGGAVDAAGRAVDARRLRWLAGNTLLGRGQTISAVLPPGTRRVRLLAADRSGRSGSASVPVTLRATTPFFLRLGAPRSLSRRARAVTLTVASTQPATLHIGSLRIALGRRARSVRVTVSPGRSTLLLRLRLTAGGKGIVQPVVIPRR